MTGLVITRLLHVVLGVFWGGTILFFGVLLGPCLGAIGPRGGPLMQELERRRYGVIMPVVGFIVVLTGIELLRRTHGSPGDWMSTRAGLTYVIGGLAAILTLLVGVFMTVPAVKRMGGLLGRMGTASPDESKSLGAELGAVQARLKMLSVVGTVLVAITVSCMAIGRYM